MALKATFRFGDQRSYSAPDLAPATPFIAIGDVHGRYDLLAPLLDRALSFNESVVLLGDYIDHGPDSASVLDLVHQATQTGKVIALRGNHEDFLLRYLVQPRVLTQRFFALGGEATLASYGITRTMPVPGPREMSRMRNELREKLGTLEDWLKNLPYVHQTGNVIALHAGADPSTPIEDQFAPSFCWGHPFFRKKARSDGHWVIHGHDPVESITVKSRRIALDTQAYRTGQLSAVRVQPGLIELF
ncbi:metallophosphoesterase [Yoonia litorea]|uniref:Serine/threonine protein phosphatase 1 n=1 Tax=Yoonia litorea TaxID=1123755 RepID=A0A1I6LDJ1_9RHOB|nr:metallophosphoesterase [Yoonia litorea]SFS01561.1 serine/threonine protein phosphatase 1 [Yoonia litorea]